MNLKNKLLTILLSLCFSISIFAVEKFSAIAKTKDGKFAYKEEHEVTYNGQLVKEIASKYFDEKGKLFATLKSTFGKNIYLPNSEFNDLRDGYFEKTELKDKKFVITTGYKGKSYKNKTKKLSINDRMVSGQGFHNFVVTNYDKMQKETEINFVVPAMRTDFTFEVQEVKADKPGTSKFKLSISNFILRMIASEIIVSYEDKTKRILTFDGLTNLQNKDGDQFNALLNYSY